MSPELPPASLSLAVTTMTSMPMQTLSLGVRAPDHVLDCLLMQKFGCSSDCTGQRELQLAVVDLTDWL